jgi:hypothetical protein
LTPHAIQRKISHIAGGTAKEEQMHMKRLTRRKHAEEPETDEKRELSIRILKSSIRCDRQSVSIYLQHIERLAEYIARNGRLPRSGIYDKYTHKSCIMRPSEIAEKYLTGNLRSLENLAMQLEERIGSDRIAEEELELGSLVVPLSRWLYEEYLMKSGYLFMAFHERDGIIRNDAGKSYLEGIIPYDRNCRTGYLNISFTAVRKAADAEGKILPMDTDAMIFEQPVYEDCGNGQATETVRATYSGVEFRSVNTVKKADIGTRRRLWNDIIAAGDEWRQRQGHGASEL